MDFIRAKLEMDIELTRRIMDYRKLPNQSFASTILLQSEYQEVSKKYAEAKYEKDVAAAAVRAIGPKENCPRKPSQAVERELFRWPFRSKRLTTRVERTNQKERTKRTQQKREN